MAPSPGQPPTPRATNQMVGTYDQFSGTHNYRDPDGNHVEMQIDSFVTTSRPPCGFGGWGAVNIG